MILVILECFKYLWVVAAPIGFVYSHILFFAIDSPLADCASQFHLFIVLHCILELKYDFIIVHY